jgi:hypothetical protein
MLGRRPRHYRDESSSEAQPFQPLAANGKQLVDCVRKVNNSEEFGYDDLAGVLASVVQAAGGQARAGGAKILKRQDARRRLAGWLRVCMPVTAGGRSAKYSIV